jgi:hypothetical protein
MEEKVILKLYFKNGYTTFSVFDKVGWEIDRTLSDRGISTVFVSSIFLVNCTIAYLFVPGTFQDRCICIRVIVGFCVKSDPI